MILSLSGLTSPFPCFFLLGCLAAVEEGEVRRRDQLLLDGNHAFVTFDYTVYVYRFEIMNATFVKRYI